jgi:hypothetical protein
MPSVDWILDHCVYETDKRIEGNAFDPYSLTREVEVPEQRGEFATKELRAREPRKRSKRNLSNSYS